MHSPPPTLMGFSACPRHFLTHECSWSHWQPRSCSTARVWHVSPPQCAVPQDVVTICCWLCSHVSFLANPEEVTLALQPFLSPVGQIRENLLFSPAFCTPPSPEATPLWLPAGNSPLSLGRGPLSLPEPDTGTAPRRARLPRGKGGFGAVRELQGLPEPGTGLGAREARGLVAESWW